MLNKIELNMRLIQYFSLIVLVLPLIYITVRGRLFYSQPLFISYFYSVLFLNIIGSIVVFVPSLNIYGSFDLYTVEFYVILGLQVLTFYFLFPIAICGNKIIEKGKNNQISMSKLLLYASLIGGGICLLFYIQYGLPPFYNANYSGGNSSLLTTRSEFLEESSRIWFYRIGFYVVPQIVGVASFLNYKTRKTFSSWLLFMVVSLIASVLALSFLHKTPVALYWFSIFICKILFEKRAKLSSIFIWLSVIFAVIVIWYLIYFPGLDIEYYFDFMLRAILNRIFGVYPMSLAYVPLIVNETGHFHGATIINPLGLLPYEVVNLSRIIHWEQFSLPGYAPPPATGYAYADFGYIGVILISSFVGMIIFILQILVNSIRNNLFRLTVLSYLCIKIIFVAMSSAAEVLLNPSELIAFIFILLVIFLTQLRIKRC